MRRDRYESNSKRQVKYIRRSFSKVPWLYNNSRLGRGKGVIMKLYNIVVNNNFSGEPFSFNAVGQNIDFDTALDLAVKYLIDDCGYDEDDYLDTDELEVIECYAIDEVDGYKVKLVKE